MLVRLPNIYTRIKAGGHSTDKTRYYSTEKCFKVKAIIGQEESASKNFAYKKYPNYKDWDSLCEETNFTTQVLPTEAHEHLGL